MSLVKSTVDARALKSALEKVFKAAYKNPSLKFLGEVKVDFSGNVCTLSCTNLNLYCQVKIPAWGDDFSFVFSDTKQVLTALKYYSGDLELICKEDRPSEYEPDKKDLDGLIALRCGARGFSQRFTTAVNYPKFPEEEAEKSYPVSASPLYERFKRIRYAIRPDSTKPQARYVFFTDERMVTIDSYRLAISRDDSLRVDDPIYICPDAMEMLPLFENGQLQIQVGKKYIVFQNDMIRVTSRRPECVPMDVDCFLPKTCKEDCEVNVSEFIRELQYLKSFDITKNESVRFSRGNLSVRSPADAEYYGAISLIGSPDTVINFNAKYMLEGLAQFRAKKVDTVTMQMTSPLSPIILTDHADDLAMVLPVQPKDAA